jgi:hypothetical protein
LVVVEGVSVIKMLLGSVPARFDSRFGLADSVERLRAESVERDWFAGLLKDEGGIEGMVGMIDSSRVRLRRVREFIQNPFAPQFVGHLVESQGAVALVGCFTMRLEVKVLMSIWCGFCVLPTLLHPVAVPAGVAMVGLGVLIVLLGRLTSRGDVAWLSDVIRSALSGDTRRGFADGR